MAPRRKLSRKALLSVLAYMVVVAAWMASGQKVEELLSYDAWGLSLPIASVLFGLAVNRGWVLAFAVIPLLATVPWWGNGCGGDDICVGVVIWIVIVPLTFFGLAVGLYVRRHWRDVPRAARCVSRRGRSTLEERHQER